MVIKARENTIGAWAFFIGVVLAVMIGLIVPLQIEAPKLGDWIPIINSVLILLGILVGLSNIRTKDSNIFLIAGIALVLVSYIGLTSSIDTANFLGLQIGVIIVSIFNSLLTLFVPATIIVALKTVFNVSS